MGLFSRKHAEPLVHPQVDRVAYVHATAADVGAHLAEYASLFPGNVEHVALLASSGAWTALRFPEVMHPWAFHNLAFWLLDTPGAANRVIAVSGPAPSHPAYRLVRDPELPDCLCGWDVGGAGWTVSVPANDIVRGEDPPVPRAVTVPEGFVEWHPVTIAFEDPARDQNPFNQVTRKRRSALRTDSFSYVV